jgi:AraC-like DNA-binding protein
MPAKRLEVTDPIMPIEFAHSFIRAAALCGIPIDSAVESTDIDSLLTIPFSKIVTMSEVLLAEAPFDTCLPIFNVLDNEPISDFISILSTAETLNEGMKCLLKYGPYASLGLIMYYRLAEHDDFFVIESDLPQESVRRFMIEMTAASCYRLVPAQFVKEVILQVEFDFESGGNDKAYEDFFGCEVKFGQAQNRIRILKGMPSMRLNSFSPVAYQRMVKKLQEKTAVILSFQGVRFQVAQIIKEQLHHYISQTRQESTQLLHADLSVESVASHLQLSVRSLQRKLKEEHCVFSAIKYQTIVDESKYYLKVGDLSLDMIAAKFGFADRASYSKAFKKYVGIWPAEYRSQLAEKVKDLLS